jgi:alcohol-forming fatty acyl-CoA reductase
VYRRTSAGVTDRQVAVQEETAQGTIAERLAGKRLLITGASGFVGKAALAACLRELPELEEVRVLLRARDDQDAERRLREQVLSSVAFGATATGDGRPVDAHDDGRPAVDSALGEGRLTAVAGDLTAERLGREDLGPFGGVDAVIHCAASVSFEQPLDEMLELNLGGPLRLVEALDEAGSEPHFVHVSTAYAAGARSGLVLERPSGTMPAEPDVDTDAELAAARAWRGQIEAESRLPEHQQRFVRDARQEVGPAGAPAIGARAERARRTWVEDQLTQRGRERCRALGWSDAYTLSKALAERALLDRAGPGKPVPLLTIVRPTIIESALRHPFPGWLEGIKVADPLFLAYGSGVLRRFPGNPSARLDLVPVDLVANACIVAAAHPPPKGVRTIAIASGARRPLLLEETARLAGEYFREHPLPDDDGLPIEIAELRFTSRRRALGALDRGQRAVAAARGLLDRVAVPRADQAERRLHRERRQLERLQRLAEIYGTYGELDCMFDDRHAGELLDELAPEDRARFDFDTGAMDWPSYLKEVHLPAVRRLVDGSSRPAPRRASSSEGALADGPPALALFDIEGVVLDANVAQFYAWLRTRTMPAPDRAVWLAGLATRAPGYLVADRRSRVGFNRRFYREYRGLPAADLRDHARSALSEFILPRVRHAAIRRIRGHRRRGDRVVLVTGALDFLVEPLRHLADDLVAARLVERAGAFTGELAEPPLSADGRASLVARLAAEHEVELADCYAYGDSISDLPLLEAVGRPAAVNPDFRLAREARRRGWPVLEWKAEPGARRAPPAPIDVAR